MEFLDNNKIVTLPANIKTLINPDFVRKSEEGDIPCYVIPPDNLLPDPLGFQYTDPMKQMDGMVQGFNLNTPKNEKLLLTNLEDILLPDKFYFKNGLVLLDVTNTGVNYHAWDPEVNDYVLLNSFTLGAVNFIEPLVINSNVIWVRIEDTDWILRQGRPFVYVQHPYRAMGYNLMDTYIHDGVTTASPAASADITLQKAHYARIVKDAIIHDNLLSAQSAIINDIFEGDIGGMFAYDTGADTEPPAAGYEDPSLEPNYTLFYEGDASAMAIKNSTIAGDIIIGPSTSVDNIIGGQAHIFNVNLGYDEDEGRTVGQCRLDILWEGGEDLQQLVSSEVTDLVKFEMQAKQFIATAPAWAEWCYINAVLVDAEPTEAIIWDGAYFGLETELPAGTFNANGDLEEPVNNQMLIVKSEPSIIKSDSIPADSLTIIGHYNEGAIGYDKASNLAKECFNQVTQYNKPLIR